MTDFDKLIKEKAEQAEYTYKPAAWKSFRRKTGLGQNALKYWVAGVSSAVVVGGLLTVLLSRVSYPTQGNEPSPNVVSVDTISMSVGENAILNDDTVLQVSNREQESPRPKTVPTASPKSNIENPNVVANHPAEASKPKKNATRRYGRPLVIDVDTIKENVPTDEELRNGHSRLY